MHLAIYPHYMHAVRKEYRDNRADYSCECPRPILDSVIHESMRLCPSIFFGSQRVTPPEGMNINGQVNGIYSQTPDGAPIKSPFIGGFDYGQFGRHMSSIPQHMSPHQGASFMQKRPSVQAQHRKSSADTRNPMTPRTSAMAGLHIGTPESGSLQNGRPIRVPSSANRHQKTVSGQFDSTPNSLQSFLDSPLASPNNYAHHAG